jgi:two-component system, OmpR family, aerobic respiration control sensor histidine kinase ArcB
VGDLQKIAEITECADCLMASSQALFNLLNEVLESIKVATGAIPLVKKKFDLKEKLLTVIELNQSKAKQKNLTLILDYDEATPELPHNYCYRRV